MRLFSSVQSFFLVLLSPNDGYYVRSTSTSKNYKLEVLLLYFSTLHDFNFYFITFKSMNLSFLLHYLNNLDKK